MDLESISMPKQDKSMKVNGEMICGMEKANTHSSLNKSQFEEPGRMDCFMVTLRSFIKMDKSFMDNIHTTKKMVKELYNTQMEQSMMEHLKRTKLVAMVS